MPIVGWRRVGSGNLCDFCAMLVSQGTLYDAESDADFEAHDGCTCTAEPVWERNAPEPPEVLVLQTAWNRVTKGASGAEARSLWRKWWKDTDSLPPLSQQQLAAMTEDELLDRFHTISVRRVLDEDALKAVDDEFTRRERLAGRDLPDDEDNSPQARRLDELLGQGRSFESAYAEAYDLDDIAFRRQVLADTVDQQRMIGESRDAAVRRLYEDRVRLQYLEAEDWTRGNLLSREGMRANIDPVTLFSGPRSRARKYASEELKRFWDERADRQTLAEFRAVMLGRQSDVKAAAGLSSGHDADFGV